MRPTTGNVRGRPIRGVLAAASVAALLTAGLAAPQTAAGSTVRRTTSTTNLGPGLTLTKINTSEPMQIRVLTIDPAKAVTLDLATAGGTFGSYARPSTMGANRGALAAINGDFTIDGRPLHPFAEDGFLRSSGLQSGGAFAESKDETHAYLGAETLHMAGTDVTTGAPFSLSSWNSGAPGAGEIAAFTSAGGSIESPPSSACSARLLPAGKLHWSAGKMGVYKDWAVDVMKCQSSSLSLGSGMVLSSKLTGAGADSIKAMHHGDTIRLSWDPGWSDVMDMVGGMPLLVDNGTVVAKNDCGTYFCERNPRTAIGTTADGKVLLVVVDGRAPGVSLGMTLGALAREMVSLGAVWAVNLDGGGGSAMWVKGQGLVTKPSDGSERPVTNALVVLPGADTAEPAPVGRVPALSAAAADDAATLAASDPASTGGLLEALLSGELGRAPKLPRAWVDAAQAFRMAQV
jgi:hypothetical protein